MTSAATSHTASSIERLARAALPAYDLPDDADVTLLNLSENATFRVNSGARDLIVRVHRAGYHTRQEIASELAWISALGSDTGINVPCVVPTRDGDQVLTLRSSPLPDERHHVAFEVIGGREPVPEELLSWMPHLGATTALLHEHARSWRPPPWFLRPAWDWSSILGDLPRWGDWRGHPGLEEHTRDLLGRAAAHAERELLDESSDRRQPTVGLIHADLRLGNILVDGDTLALLDFDDCGPGYVLWDLATVFTGIEDDPRLDTAVHTWLDGYRAVTDLGPPDIALIPTLIMLRRLQVLAWLVSHPDTDLAKAAIGPYTQTTTTLAERYLAHRLVSPQQH